MNTLFPKEPNITNIISVEEGKIIDFIDGKTRNDTPEEYVRQNIEKKLVYEHKYPKEIIQIEFSIKSGAANRRVDIAIFPDDCKDFTPQKIKIAIECKKESIPPSDKKDGVEQMKTYMAGLANCEFGLWTNGKEREVYRKVFNDKGHVEFSEVNDIPSFGQTAEEADRPTRANQTEAVADNLLFAFKNCHNHIYVNEGLQKEPAFFELLKIIFCKIEDERNILEEPLFYVTSKERNNQDGHLAVKRRLDKLFDKVKTKYKTIFDPLSKLDLKPRTCAGLVGTLQKYSLLRTGIDVKGKAYEEIVGSNLRGDRGEFFTPRNIMEMAVKMINPQINEKVLDSSCGTGGFLVSALSHVTEQIYQKTEKNFGKKRKLFTSEQHSLVSQQIAAIAKKCFFGFDINPNLVKATKMNMVMNNDGSGNILRENSLLPPHEWDSAFKEQLAAALEIEPTNLRSWRDIALFDVIVTNPPFGSKLPVEDRSILEQFNVASGKNSVPPEQVFVERCVQFLKPGGRMAIVLPDNILGGPSLIHIRRWLLKNTKLIASVDLDVDTFQPKNGTQTSILVVQKKTELEIAKQEDDYEVFMAIVDKVGHDQRGAPVYQLDEEGNIMVFDVETEMPDGTVIISKERKLDDQSVLVPSVFEEWKKEHNIIW